MQSEAGNQEEEVEDPGKIVIVQVGEKPREYKNQESGKFERQGTN